MGDIAANATCIGFTLLYVSGFYLFKQPGSRNDPNVIRARIKAVTVASFISALIVWYLLDQQDIFTVLGLIKPKISSHIIDPLLLTAFLFLGPLSVMLFDQELPFQKYFDYQRDFIEIFTTLLGIRNYIVAPITEEFVFRACIIAILFQANYSINYLIFASPLYFGIAHLHHAWDNYNTMNRTRQALKNAVLTSSFQFTYTTVFGWYASYLFLKTGSILPPILCHSFCNMMGFPDFSGIQHRSTLQKTAIYICFPIGIGLFIYNFQNLIHGESMYCC